MRDIDSENVEITRRYKTRKVGTLKHVYFAVLQLSKMDLYIKIFGLAALSRPGAFSLSYINTDSITFGYHNQGNTGLLSIMDKNKYSMKEWYAFFEKHFVTNKMNTKQLGLLKLETSVKGHFIVTGPKQYLYTDENIEKQAVVGVNKKQKLSFEEFLSSVYDGQHTTVVQARKNTVNNKFYIKNDLIKVLAKPYIKGVVSQNKVDIIHFPTDEQN